MKTRTCFQLCDVESPAHQNLQSAAKAVLSGTGLSLTQCVCCQRPRLPHSRDSWRRPEQLKQLAWDHSATLAFKAMGRLYWFYRYFSVLESPQHKHFYFVNFKGLVFNIFFQFQLTFNFIFCQFQVCSIVLRQSCTLPSGPPVIATFLFSFLEGKK